jgi:hypothetical protein
MRDQFGRQKIKKIKPAQKLGGVPMIAKISPASALVVRRAQAAIVARLWVTICLAFAREYRRKHIGAIFTDILVGMLIRQNDDDGKPPLSISCIAKILNMPRSNVKRATDALMSQGVIISHEGAFTENEAFIAGRLDSNCAATIIGAILKAADDLGKVGRRQTS